MRYVTSGDCQHLFTLIIQVRELRVLYLIIESSDYYWVVGEALIAYIILMVVVPLPLFVLELSLGQFGQTGVIKLWRAVPFFKG